MPTDMMQLAHETYAGLMKQFVSRRVTYRGVRNSQAVSKNLDVQVGSSQTFNLNNLGLDTVDPNINDPAAVHRDYIIQAVDLGELGEPRDGDSIDDPNDFDGINRYSVTALTGQDNWRWLKGSLNVLARVHTKRTQKIKSYWSDAFNGDDGTVLADHAPDVPESGSYAVNAGALSLLGNRLATSSATAYAYFLPNEFTTVSRCDFKLGGTADSLEGKAVELGLAVRCAVSGSGRRDGYYCTVRVGYANGEQATRQVRIVRRRGGVNSTLDVLNLPDELVLANSYGLVVKNLEQFVIVSLQKSDGKDVPGSTRQYEATLLNSNKGQGIYFENSVADPSVSWIDNVTVEAS